MELCSPSQRKQGKCSVCSRRFASRRLASVHWAAGHCTEGRGRFARRFRRPGHKVSEEDRQTSFGAELETGDGAFEDFPDQQSQDLESEEETLAPEEQMSFTSVPEGDSSLDESELASEPKEAMSTPATEDTELSHTRDEVASEAEPDPSEETPKGSSSVASRLQRSLGRVREAALPPSGRSKRKGSGGRRAKRWRPEKLLCRKCGRFRSAKLCALLLHKQACLGKGIRTFECTHCPFKHFSPKLFQRHLDTHNEPKDKTSKLALKKAPVEFDMSESEPVEELPSEPSAAFEPENVSTQSEWGCRDDESLAQPAASEPTETPAPTFTDQEASEDDEKAERVCDACGFETRSLDSMTEHLEGGSGCQRRVRALHRLELGGADGVCPGCSAVSAGLLRHFYSLRGCALSELRGLSRCPRCGQEFGGSALLQFHLTRPTGQCHGVLEAKLSPSLCPKGCGALLSSPAKAARHADSVWGCRFTKLQASSELAAKIEQAEFMEAKIERSCDGCGMVSMKQDVMARHCESSVACKRYVAVQHKKELSDDGVCRHCAASPGAFLQHFYSQRGCALATLGSRDVCPLCKAEMSSGTHFQLHVTKPQSACRALLDDAVQPTPCPKGCGAVLSHPAKAQLHAQSTFGCLYSKLYLQTERPDQEEWEDNILRNCDTCSYATSNVYDFLRHSEAGEACQRRIYRDHKAELGGEGDSCPHCSVSATALLRHFYSPKACVMGEETQPTPCPKGCGAVLSHPEKATLHAQSIWGCVFVRAYPLSSAFVKNLNEDDLVDDAGETRHCDTCDFEAGNASAIVNHLDKQSCKLRLGRLHREELWEGNACPHCSSLNPSNRLAHFYSAKGCALGRFRDHQSCPSCGFESQQGLHSHLMRSTTCVGVLRADIQPTPCPKGCGAVLSHPAKAELHALSAWGCRYAQSLPKSEPSKAIAEREESSREKMACDTCGFLAKSLSDMEDHSESPSACGSYVRRRHGEELLTEDRTCPGCSASYTFGCTLLPHFYSRTGCARSRPGQKEAAEEEVLPTPCPRACGALLSNPAKADLHAQSAWGCLYAQLHPRSQPSETIAEEEEDGSEERDCDACGFRAQNLRQMAKHCENPVACGRDVKQRHGDELMAADLTCPTCSAQCATRTNLLQHFYSRKGCALSRFRGLLVCPVCGLDSERLSNHLRGRNNPCSEALGIEVQPTPCPKGCGAVLSSPAKAALHAASVWGCLFAQLHRPSKVFDADEEQDGQERHCDKCGFQARNLSHMEAHSESSTACGRFVTRRHGQELFTEENSCPSCSTPFQHASRLLVHFHSRKGCSLNSSQGPEELSPQPSEPTPCPKGCGAVLSNPAKAALHARSAWGCRYVQFHPQAEQQDEGPHQSPVQRSCDTCSYETSIRRSMMVHSESEQACRSRLSRDHRAELVGEDESCLLCHQSPLSLLKHFYSWRGCVQDREAPAAPCAKGCGAVFNHPAKAAFHERSVWGCRYAQLYAKPAEAEAEGDGKDEAVAELFACDKCAFQGEGRNAMRCHMKGSCEASLKLRHVAELHEAAAACPVCEFSTSSGSSFFKHLYSDLGCVAQQNLRSDHCPLCFVKLRSEFHLRLHFAKVCSEALRASLSITTCPNGCGARFSHPEKAALHAASRLGCLFYRLVGSRVKAEELTDDAGGKRSGSDLEPALPAAKAESGDPVKAEAKGEEAAKPAPVEQELLADEEEAGPSRPLADRSEAEEEDAVPWEDSESEAEEEEISLHLAAASPHQPPLVAKLELIPGSAQAPAEERKPSEDAFEDQNTLPAQNNPTEPLKEEQASSPCQLCSAPLDTPAARAVHTRQACGEARYEAAIERHKDGGAYVCPKCSGRHRRRPAFLNHAFECKVNLVL